ncbi:putative immunity protein [Devosia sediminis]|uniref:Imm-5-like domain-containing protein n=1 Tax=Devosia sediminis TaxID=2798801 RepID=A0A934IT32_9HYPH|nr:hypothetical protein [Devosia sediminis]MBJ3783817.1 hypothetical protein [Devosia sediminis]
MRRVALWAAGYAARALPVFERQHPGDPGPRDAVAAGRAFAEGATRDKALRTAAWAAHKAAGRAPDALAKHAARAAMLTAAVAYTHTDLTEGDQGISQAQHLLGPVVYAAMALGAEDLLDQAVADAPPELIRLLLLFPPQPGGRTQLKQLFQKLDAALRAGGAR